MAFLRAADLTGIKAAAPEILAESMRTNEMSREFVEFVEHRDKANLNLAWRQYLRWFMTAEHRVEAGELRVGDALVTAKRNWEIVKSRNIVIAEP